MVAGELRGVEHVAAIEAEVVVALEQGAVGEQRHALGVALAAISHRDDRADLEMRLHAGAGIDASSDGKALLAGFPPHPIAGVEGDCCLPVNPTDWQAACIELENHGN